MKNLIIVLLLVSGSPILAQYNVINTRVNNQVYDRIRELNALKLAGSAVVYRVSVAPEFAIFQSAWWVKGGYWRSLAITQNSANHLFTSTYDYDMRGNLVETRSYFNIPTKGNQSAKVRVQFLPSPVFVRTIP